VTRDGGRLKYVPMKYRDYQLCKAAVQHNMHAMRFVPKDLLGREILERIANLKMKTYDDWLADVTRDSVWLQGVPEQLIDHNMCLAAVAQDGWSLQHVPPQLRDYPTCRAAVQHTMHAIRFVPEDLVGRDFLEIMAGTR